MVPHGIVRKVDRYGSIYEGQVDRGVKEGFGRTIHFDGKVEEGIYEEGVYLGVVRTYEDFDTGKIEKSRCEVDDLTYPMIKGRYEKNNRPCGKVLPYHGRKIDHHD